MGDSSAVCNVLVGKIGQLAGGEVGFEGVGDGLGGVEAAELERAVDAHEHGLGGGALLTAIRLAVLPQDDGRTNLSFAEVVVIRHIRVVQEREQILPVLHETFGQAAGVRIAVLHGP